MGNIGKPIGKKSLDPSKHMVLSARDVPGIGKPD
jgi:hypothetical protein